MARTPGTPFSQGEVDDIGVSIGVGDGTPFSQGGDDDIGGVTISDGDGDDDGGGVPPHSHHDLHIYLQAFFRSLGDDICKVVSTDSQC